MVIQRYATDSGLYPAVQIVGLQIQHPVHSREVDGNAAAHRLHVAFNGGTRPERYDR